MDLRPLSYEEMCQMEMLRAAAVVSNVGGAGTGKANGTNLTQGTGAGAGATAAQQHPHPQQQQQQQSMLPVPIMMIPSSMMPPGTTILAAADRSSSCDHFYQLQPTHLIAGAALGMPESEAGVGADNGGALADGVDSLNVGVFGTAAPLLQHQHQHQHQLELEQCEPQHPQHPQQQDPQRLNILYTGTLTKPHRAAMVDGRSLPRRLQSGSFIVASVSPVGSTVTTPATSNATTTTTNTDASASHTGPGGQVDESDLEGSECGASVSATTCIPHFRFGGCSIMLPPAAHHPRPDTQVVGCTSLSHMMGTFATADRLAGVGANLSGALGYSRRTAPSAASATATSGIGQASTSVAAATGTASAMAAVHATDNATQTPKRVSFKGDTLRPNELLPIDDIGAQLNADAFNNCSYMHFDHFMDYQTTGFGGLPDVTEHSNVRRTLSRQNSLSNSDSGGEIASIQKSKVNFSDFKSPSSTSGKAGGCMRKSKAAQQCSSNAMPHYKSTRRGTCIVWLTLLGAICLLAIAATLAYQHFLMAPSRNSHAQRLKIVRRILREVPLVDGHNNFAWSVRKYAHSSLEWVHIGHSEDHQSLWTRPVWTQTDMERLRQGLVGVQVWSAYVPCEAQGLDAVQLALEQIDIIRRLADIYTQDTVLVTSSQDISSARRHGLMASLIGIEGGHAIGSSLGVLRSFYSLGARYLSLTHKCDVSWAGSSMSPLENGLTQFGKAIIREMNRLGMMIDLSYSSDATARDVLQVTRAPVIFSHSAARQLCNSTHNVPDDILRLVAENGGLIMISFDSEDVACGRQAHLTDVIEHIKHVRSIAGIQHIGLGAGYDSIETPPLGLEDVSKYPDLLATLLEDHNWSEDDVAMLAGKNFLRIMETVENVRDYWKRAAIQPIEQTEPQPKSQCTYMSS